jgi:D-psicose/D-tagatose/L-ribulose 3-epimerase
MLFGMNMLLWTTDVAEEHLPLFDELGQMGYGAVEIPVFNIADPDGYATLGAHARAAGLTPYAIAALNETQNIASADAAIRRAGEADLLRMVDAAAAMGASCLSGPLHSALGVFTGAGPTADEIERSAEVLERVAGRAASAGVRLGLEPLNRFECYLLNDAASAAALARRVGHGAGVLYDTFHAHIEEKDVGGAIRALGADIAVVHISENDRSTPGQGQVRWVETFAALKASGYQGPLIVEAFGLALPALAAATRIWRRTFADELGLAREALTFMQQQWEDAAAS